MILAPEEENTDLTSFPNAAPLIKNTEGEPCSCIKVKKKNNEKL